MKIQFYYMLELNILSNSATDPMSGEIENVWNIWKENFLELLNFRKYNSIQNLEVTEGYVQMLKYLVIPDSTKADQKKTKNHRNQQAGKYNLDKNGMRLKGWEVGGDQFEICATGSRFKDWRPANPSEHLLLL